MKKLFLILLLVATVATTWAQRIGGIRVDSPAFPVVVYVNNQKMCDPVNSFFLSNITRGTYCVEVYALEGGHSHGSSLREVKILTEHITYRGSGIVPIMVRGERHDDCYDEPSRRAMGREAFNRFYANLKAETFDSNKTSLINTAIKTGAWFSTAQVEMLVSTFSFDSGKLTILKSLYPVIDDKQNIVTVLGAFTFKSSKDEFMKFVSNYNNRR